MWNGLRRRIKEVEDNSRTDELQAKADKMAAEATDILGGAPHIHANIEQDGFSFYVGGHPRPVIVLAREWFYSSGHYRLAVSRIAVAAWEWRINQPDGGQEWL